MEDDEKKCPFCGEIIKVKAKKCRHCGEWLENVITTSPDPITQPTVSVSRSNISVQNISTLPSEPQRIIEESLAMIKEVEEEMLPQLNYIGQKIDATYAERAKLVADVSSAIVKYSGSLLSEKSKGRVELVGGLISAFYEHKAKVEEAKMYNKYLDELLSIKQSLANEKSPVLKSILSKLCRQIGRHEKIINSRMEKMYSIVTEEDERNLNYEIANSLNLLNQYRQLLYWEFMIEHLSREYGAWLNGIHSAEEQVPGYDTVNLFVEERYYNSDIHKAFGRLMNMSSSMAFSGKDLYLVSDEQLVAMNLMYNPWMDDGGPQLPTYTPKNKIISNALNNVKLYSDYEKTKEKVLELYENYQSTPNWITYVVCGVWCVIVYNWLWVNNHGFYAFLAWTLGTLVVGFIAHYAVNEDGRRHKYKQASMDLYKKIRGTWGNLWRPKGVALQKKSVSWF